MRGFDRRAALGMIGGAAAAPLLPLRARAQPAGLTMWRDPGCGCCLEWARRIEAAFGPRMRVVETGDMAAVKRARGVPAELHSCHTALIHGFVAEGHVPPADLKRLIAGRNPRIRGLAVAGMPAGAPGMDVGHDHREPYAVYAFGSGPSVIFAKYDRAR